MMMQFGIFFRALISGISILEKRDENGIEENNICSDIVVRIEKKRNCIMMKWLVVFSLSI